MKRRVDGITQGCGALPRSCNHAELHGISAWRRGDRVDMRLRYIELFHAILTSGSITGAAKLLDISQPAASKALQHAENQLGFALFSRVRGRIQPTQQAQLLRDRIENIIQEVQDLERLTAN